MLKGITLTVPSGITVLLGPNGAGKSTLFAVVSGALPATTGVVTWDGQDISRPETATKMRAALGWMPQSPRFPSRLRVDRLLETAAWLKGLAPDQCRHAAAHALARVGLVDFADRGAGQLSGGETRRLALAVALVADPSVMVLDEPTNGLDPGQRERLHATLRDLGTSRTLVVSTHLLEDVQALARNVVVLDAGQVRYDGDLAGFVGGSEGHPQPPSLESMRAAWGRVVDGREVA